MTDKEKIAYIVGMAVALGFKLRLRRQCISLDANANNPYRVTTENGHHFLIDKFGTIQSGRLKETPIDNVKKHYSGIKNKKEKNLNVGTELSRNYGLEIKTKLDGVDAIRKSPGVGLDILRIFGIENLSEKLILCGKLQVGGSVTCIKE